MPARPGPLGRNLLEGPVARTIFLFSLPLLTTNFLHSLNGAWGAIWVSRELGEGALTAVVNVNVFMFMMMGAIMGAGTAAGVAIGQARGAGDSQAIKRVVGTSITCVLAVSLVMAGLGVLYAQSIVDLMQLPPGARVHGVVFLRVTCLTMPSIFTFIFCMMMLRGSGDARTPFRFSIVWIVLGLILTPILLTGAFGLPKLGIAGAALGNLAASLIALLSLIVYVSLRRMPLSLRGAELSFLKPDLSIMRMLAVRGAPMALETLIVQGAYFVLLRMVNAYGDDTAAAYAGAAQLWGYVQMPANALAASMSAMAAISIGADRWDRVEELALKGVIVSILLTTLATAIVYALGAAPLRLFLPHGGEALEIARRINYIALWGWIVLSITSGLAAVVRANAAMLPPTIIFFITMWLMRVPIASGLQPWLGSDAIWWSFPAGTFASAALAWAYFRFGGWRRNGRILSGFEAEGAVAVAADEDPARPKS